MDIARIKNMFTIPKEYIREFRRRNQQYTQTSSIAFYLMLVVVLIGVVWYSSAVNPPSWTVEARNWYVLAMIALGCSIIVLLRLRTSVEYLRAATIISVITLMICSFCFIQVCMSAVSPDNPEVYGYLNNTVVALCLFAVIFVVRLDLRTTVILQGVIAAAFVVQGIVIRAGGAEIENFGETISEMIVLCALSMLAACVFSSVLIHSFMGEKNLEDLASCDALTRVHNRRGFDVMLSRVLQDARVTGATVSLLIIDIDKFKAYNDTYGHVEGDRCLAAVAKSIAGSVRKNDFVARYGGEEFAVIMENTPREAAERAANQMLEDIRARQIRHEGSEVGILTFSVGGVTFKASQLSSPDYYIKLADEGLYIAKESGRNRVIFNRQSM